MTWLPRWYRNGAVIWCCIGAPFWLFALTTEPLYYFRGPPPEAGVLPWYAAVALLCFPVSALPVVAVEKLLLRWRRPAR